MGVLQFLFPKRPAPALVYHDDQLGDMRYSQDDEAWGGMFNGLPVSVAYTGQPGPELSLIEYGVSLARDRTWLEAQIAKQSAQYVSENPTYQGEVRGLVTRVVHVYRHKGTNKALRDLGAGRDDRAWRIEFTERTCDGIGYDS